MTYIQLTTCCNFSCEHCCMDYGNGKRGRHMKWDTFLGALSYVEDHEEFITLGGGEPTLNPIFKRAVTYILENTNLSIWVATNGSQTAVMNWYISERWNEYGQYSDDRFDMVLSADPFHDLSRVDDRVYEWFARKRGKSYGYSRSKLWGDGRESVQPIGRAVNLSDYWFKDPPNLCPCEDVTIYPDGRITACGCKDSPEIGNIFGSSYAIANGGWYDDLPHADSCYCNNLKLVPA